MVGSTLRLLAEIVVASTVKLTLVEIARYSKAFMVSVASTGPMIEANHGKVIQQSYLIEKEWR